MQYMLLIYNDETIETSPEEFAEYGVFTQEVQSNGTFVNGAPLDPTTTATTVRVRDGKSMLTDGPFAETKEQLGGYYLLECKDLDEACKYAAKIPAARIGSIEVRPVMQLPDMG